jgi:hypothetical protein
MRLARPFTPIVLLAVFLVGCGSSGSDETATVGTEATTRSSGAEAPAGASAKSCASDAAAIGQLRVTNVDCGTANVVAAVWSKDTGCEAPATAARSSCSARGYRCLGTVVDNGTAVSCARPGRSVSFVAKRR